MAHFGHLCFPLCRIPITPWVKNTVFSYAKGERNSLPEDDLRLPQPALQKTALLDGQDRYQAH
jgi:hypothetical protein